MSMLFILGKRIYYKGRLIVEIEGTYTLQATPDAVWQSLVDRQMLLHTLPEIEKLERIDEYTHTLALHIDYTPLFGTYYGRIRVAESQYPHHSRVIIEGVRDTQNTISGEAILNLTSHEDTTTVNYNGTIHLNKVGVELQRTVVKGATKLLVQQFFTLLEEQLWQQHEAKKRIEAELARLAAKRAAVSRKRPKLKRATPALLQRIVHLLGIGKGDVVEEERWTQRIRRTSYASMLLFLIWVGTRLPRR